jgi:CelD/BcsL family acetyltransferase involved in cellulose biosynthesis
MQMSVNSKYTVTEETFDSINAYWLDPQYHLNWDCLFVLPGWLKVWWDTFGSRRIPYLCSVRHKNELIGIAPFMIQGESVRFMGDANVCDYMNVIVRPERGIEFFEVLGQHLKQQGVSQLDLGAMRADSVVLSDISAAAKRLHYKVFCEPEDVSMELELPLTWDAFLKGLTGKERHEIRRKLRRLNEAAHINFRVVESKAEAVEQIDTFFELFKLNRSDKWDFMTDQRALFFRSLAEVLAEARILKLFFLDLDEAPAAAVMCFDYNSTVYLYNNGYDDRYRSLSIGLLSKVFTIQDSIQRGKIKYDFLKGPEVYKKRLGGKPVQLFRCRVELR